MSPAHDSQQSDPFDLRRFLSAQERVFDTALAELRSGRKQTHWMWFVFPQLAGLGRSATAQQFAVRGLEEARAYLQHPILGPRLLNSCQALLALRGKSASVIMGSPDDLKLRSCMTLFALVPGSPPEFRGVLEKYFEAIPDPLTLKLLNLDQDCLTRPDR